MRRFPACLVPIALVTLSAPALADQIDGDWCHDGRHLHIDGPQIKTPGGNVIAGDYTRHGFVYVVPDGEENAGATVAMRQLNDEMVRVATTSAAGQAIGDEVTWNRCQVTS